jgi:hypothetical protein
MRNMMPTDEQYERIGRYLDGEELALSGAERRLAEQIRDDEARVAGVLAAAAPAGTIERTRQRILLAGIRRDEAALAGRLEAPVPPGTLQRVHRRVVAELARPRRRLMRIGAAATAAAAAAAVLLVAALSTAWLSPDKRSEIAARPEVQAVPVEVISASVEEPRDVAVELLAREIDQLEYDILAAAPPTEVEMGIEQVERALEEFWLDMDEMLE